MTIIGKYDTREVFVGDNELKPAHSQRVFNHSPDGFNWGYGGSGPAQLALALLLIAGVPEAAAVRLHQRFKSEVIARLQQGDFSLDYGQLESWIAQHSREIEEVTALQRRHSDRKNERTK
jgi:hypothetical protein